MQQIIKPADVRPWKAVLWILAFIAGASLLALLAGWLRSHWGWTMSDILMLAALCLAATVVLGRRMTVYIYQMEEQALVLRQLYAHREKLLLTIPFQSILSFERVGPYGIKAAQATRVDYFCFKRNGKRPLWLLVYDDQGQRHAVMLQPDDDIAQALLEVIV